MKTRSNLSRFISSTVAATLVSLCLSFATRALAGPVTQLIWSIQPGNATSGQTFGTQPVLSTADVNGTPSTSGLPPTLYVTVSLSSGTGALLGTTNYNIGTSGGNGTVNFTDLQIGMAGNNDRLTAAITPAPGAVVWLDANDLSTLETNGTGAVTNWSNKGVLGLSMVVPPPGVINYQPPTLTANSMNGLPVLRFNYNGANNNVLSNRWTSPAVDVNNSITFFTALRETADPIGNWSGFIGFGNTAESSTKHNDTLGEDSGWSTTGFRIIRNDTSGSPAYGNAGQFTLANTNTGIGANFNETGLGSWYNLRPANNAAWVNAFWMDGGGNGADYWVDQSGNSWTNFQVTSTTGAFNITDVGVGMQMDQPVGAIGDTPDWPLPVDIGEVVVYNTALSAADQAAVQFYLQGKWLTTLYTSAVSAPFSVLAPGSLVISSSVISGGNLTLNGSGGTANAGFRVVSSTDLTIAQSSWTPVASGNFDGNGNFSIPIGVNPAEPARFYRVVTP